MFTTWQDGLVICSGLLWLMKLDALHLIDSRQLGNMWVLTLIKGIWIHYVFDMSDFKI